MADSSLLPDNQPPVPDGIKTEFEEVPLDSSPASCQRSTKLRIKSEQVKAEEDWLETMMCSTPSVNIDNTLIDLKCEAFKSETEGFDSYPSSSSLNTEPFLQKKRQNIKSDMDHLENIDSVQDIKSTLRERYKPKPRRTFECDQCGLIFGRKDNFIVHTYIHTGKKPHSCSVCLKSFSRADGLAVHMRFHTGERPYKCDQCGKDFITSAHFKEHQFTHTGTKPYACQHCDKSFGHPNDLTKHQRIHTGERPYPCAKCGMSFRRSQTLRNHVFRKHERKVSFPCSNCTKVFKTEGRLEQHLRSHCNKKHSRK